MGTGLPTECPRCHQAVEPGFALTNTAMRWQKNPDEIIETQLTVIPWWSRNNLPGFRCPDCKLLVLDYSEFAK